LKSSPIISKSFPFGGFFVKHSITTKREEPATIQERITKLAYLGLEFLESKEVILV